MIRCLIQWWNARQLRKARERLAYWKGYHAELERQLSTNDYSFTLNPHNKNRLVTAAGSVELYTERVETLYREQCTKRP